MSIERVHKFAHWASIILGTVSDSILEAHVDSVLHIVGQEILTHIFRVDARFGVHEQKGGRVWPLATDFPGGDLEIEDENGQRQAAEV